MILLYFRKTFARYLRRQIEISHDNFLLNRRRDVKDLMYLVDEMPVEFKQLLTQKSSKIITPQMSFYEYFKDRRPKYDRRTFETKFVEILNMRGKRIFFNAYRDRRMGYSNAEGFWKNFSELFEDQNIQPQTRTTPQLLKMKLAMMDLLKTFKISTA